MKKSFRNCSKNESYQKVMKKKCLEKNAQKIVANHKMPKPTHKLVVETKDYAWKMFEKKNI